MTNEEAAELREKLSKHYGDRLFTVGEFCAIFRKWADAASDYLRIEYDVKDVNRLFLAAHKSSLLGRLMYGPNEVVRTKKCPTHDGRWCGLFIECPCEGTGWLPEEK